MGRLGEEGRSKVEDNEQEGGYEIAVLRRLSWPAETHPALFLFVKFLRHLFSQVVSQRS